MIKTCGHLTRTYPKIIFWLNLGVVAVFQVLGILVYACGVELGYWSFVI